MVTSYADGFEPTCVTDETDAVKFEEDPSGAGVGVWFGKYPMAPKALG
jgi:hypothetical protein